MKTWDEYLEEAWHSIDRLEAASECGLPYPREILIDLRAYWLQALDNFKESL